MFGRVLPVPVMEVAPIVAGGTPVQADTVRESPEGVIAETEADEPIVAVAIIDQSARVRGCEILARAPHGLRLPLSA
jgi:hypothetical protein